MIHYNNKIKPYFVYKLNNLIKWCKIITICYCFIKFTYIFAL